ncbi:accessory gene regulator B family protein [Paenibacillus taichungensis]|uniref:accessory gene regulator B family protein n=1 Tax=Paenibacillus taichungensis TaxID=484184 RepID=UPI002DBB5B73|nr:accessory gene regulator B family protein [Paenibacillus taichungensis]MEC0110378.1 accessory gene regulator B family protein [Paenibacillus taichungensis]MEC0200054.1 accessory gene regulator B family protein [Paenibacillus taichungensis]
MSTIIAQSINKADPTTDIELMEYSLKNRLNQAFALLIAGLMCLYTHQWLGVVVTYMLLIVIRGRSGGVHLPSITLCSLVSGMFLGFVPVIKYSNEVVFILTLISAVIFIIFAPNYFHDRDDDGRDLQNKLIVTIIALSNLFFLSSLMATVLIVQAVTILPWRRR